MKENNMSEKTKFLIRIKNFGGDISNLIHNSGKYNGCSTYSTSKYIEIYKILDAKEVKICTTFLPGGVKNDSHRFNFIIEPYLSTEFNKNLAALASQLIIKNPYVFGKDNVEKGYEIDNSVIEGFNPSILSEYIFN